MRENNISYPAAPQDDILILIIDDNQEHCEFISLQMKENGYQSLTARHGREGCKIIENQGADVAAIILDREMPVMDGLEFIEWLKTNGYGHIPVIMVTKDDQPETVKQGVDAGVFYYLTKPIRREVLDSVVMSAVSETKRRRAFTKEMQSHGHSLKLIHQCVFFVQTLADAENVSCLLANFYPEPQKVLQGIAQLIINAVEHGNMGITYEQKTTLLEQKSWRAEVMKRQQLPENQSKKVTVYFENATDEYRLTIKDEGDGFDWRYYYDLNPSRALHNHGRGIAQARMGSFDRLDYNDKGNEVLAIVTKHQNDNDINWE